MIKLGILGFTDGNGHPYSYSSIFNGYNKDLMEDCPFPSIPKYLSNYTTKADLINFASVTHIWTQDIKQSRKIASATNIVNIVNHYEEMIGYVDGIILARDDYENHLTLARPFINAGIPIFIDKPLATRKEKAIEILELQKYQGQIFSSSTLAFDPRVIKAKEELKKIGEIRFVQGNAPGIWENYSIHLIDCFIKIFGKLFILNDHSVINNNNLVSLVGNLKNGAHLEINCMGGFVSPLRITIVGSEGFYDIDFKDPYNAFKNALEVFTKNINKKSIIRSKEEILKSINLISLGL